MTTIADQITEVAKYRQKVAEADAAWKERLTSFETANGALLVERAISKSLLYVAENDLRKMALEAYAASDGKAKKIAPGVGIRVEKHLEYEVSDALAWARMTHQCLVLDQAAFESVAVGLGLAFVTVLEEPKVTIAKDLAKARRGRR